MKIHDGQLHQCLSVFHRIDILVPVFFQSLDLYIDISFLL